MNVTNKTMEFPNETHDEHIGLRGYMFGLVLVWGLTVLALFWWTVEKTREGTRSLAVGVAVAHFNKDLALRKWAALHGGVYVPADERTPPNPHLAHIPERDIRTPSGRKLTLMNPAYTLRQVQEEFSKGFGVRGHITGLKYFRPETAPDAWEKAALHSFESGAKEAKEFTEIAGEPYLRLMRPLETAKECLKCHAFQGYKVGDLRGGLGVSLPMKPFLGAEFRQITAHILAYGSICVVGIAGIVLGFRRLERRDTERNLARQTLERAYLDIDRLNKALLDERSMFFHGNVVVFKWRNEEGLPVEYVSPNVRDVLGYSEDDFVTGKVSYADIIHREDIKRVVAEIGRHRKSDRANFEHEDYRIIRKDGRSIWLYHFTTIVRNDESEIDHCLGYVIDVTERKLIETALKESQERYRSLYSMMRRMCDNVPDMIWAKDMDRRYVFANRAVCENLLIAGDTEEPMGKNDMFFAERERNSKPEDPEWHSFGEVCADSDAIVMKTGKPERFDEFGNVQGEFLYLDVYKAPFWNEQGEMIGTVGCGRVVTEERRLAEALRRSHEELEERVEQRTEELAAVNRHLKEEISRRAQAEEALRNANKRITRILESISDGFIVLDNDLVLTYFNKAAEELMGRKSEDVTGRPLLEAFPEVKGSIFEKKFAEALKERRPLSFETFFDVEPYRNWYDVRVFPHHEGISVYFLVTTERKEREDRIKASLKEKVVLLREIHHRVKNNLALVNSLLSLQSARADNEHRVMFEDLEARVRSMALAHERLYLSESLERLDLEDYVGGLVDHLVGSLPLGTPIELRKEIEDLSLNLDTAIPLGFILTELISNCLKHAFPETRTGVIMISLRSAGEDAFELVVRDNGVGMPDDVHPAHPESLGLDLVNAFVNKLKGNMEIIRDRGTLVRLRFKEIGRPVPNDSGLVIEG
jgi:PAS domain S-box-containing protein